MKTIKNEGSSMSKIELTSPLSSYEGRTELSFRFQKDEEDFGYNATVSVWVVPSDSVAEMRQRAADRARVFLSQMLSALDAEYPPQSKPL
jgi:hypothetical protein